MNDVADRATNEDLDFPTWMEKWDRDSGKAEQGLLGMQSRAGEEAARIESRIAKLEALLAGGTGEGVEVSQELAHLEARKRKAASRVETIETFLNLLRQ